MFSLGMSYEWVCIVHGFSLIVYVGYMHVVHKGSILGVGILVSIYPRRNPNWAAKSKAIRRKTKLQPFDVFVCMPLFWFIN